MTDAHGGFSTYLFLKLINCSALPEILFSLPSLMNTIHVMYIPGENNSNSNNNMSTTRTCHPSRVGTTSMKYNKG